MKSIKELNLNSSAVKRQLSALPSPFYSDIKIPAITTYADSTVYSALCTALIRLGFMISLLLQRDDFEVNNFCHE
jgi:hypothetical protein